MLLVGTVALVVLSGAHSASAQVCGPTGPASEAQTESRLFELANRDRVASGAAALGPSLELLPAARMHAVQMAAAGDIFHQSNEALAALLESLGGRLIAENVGVGCDGDQLHQAFMASPKHRDNILNPSLTNGTVGAWTGVDGRIYVVELFISYGAAPRTTPPASAGPAARVALSAVTPLPIMGTSVEPTRSGDPVPAPQPAAPSPSQIPAPEQPAEPVPSPAVVPTRVRTAAAAEGADDEPRHAAPLAAATAVASLAVAGSAVPALRIRRAR